MLIRRTGGGSAEVRSAVARKAETRPVGRVFNMGNYDENEGPLAYLITFRTYGTWLHGDDRTSVDRHGKNEYNTPKILPNANLQTQMIENSLSNIFTLDRAQRPVFERAIRSVCTHRGYCIYAVNVRTNHVHCVVSAAGKPEPVMNGFKSNCTRELRAAGLISADQQVWSRGGSTRYLWKPTHVDGAVNYVLYGQGNDLPNF